jgi:two-component system OmpR family response regulator
MTTPTNKCRRVLVVDDEANIAELVATALRYEGFEVRTAADGASALAAVRDLAPDLVVLDVMLPDADGFDLQARIRADGQRVPVLFLTARDAVEDRVRGLTLGADDYMTKPFSLEELVARVHAVLRRTSGAAAVSHRLSFADLELDEETRDVRRGGRRIQLSPTEFSLLRYLLLNSRKVLSKAQRHAGPRVPLGYGKTLCSARRQQVATTESAKRLCRLLREVRHAASRRQPSARRRVPVELSPAGEQRSAKWLGPTGRRVAARA